MRRGAWRHHPGEYGTVIALSDIRSYRQTLQASLDRGNATEHTHRPTLQALLESGGAARAINEPKRIACGAPDFVVTAADNAPVIGYIETKDADANLNRVEREEQLRRYRDALPNLILTNYTEFRWYSNGELHRVADLDGPDGPNDVGLLLNDFLRRTAQPVASAEELARRMAHLTRLVRDVVTRAFERGEVSGSVRDLYEATKEALVPDLTESDFSDMFAQTLAYGLFAARINHQSNNQQPNNQQPGNRQSGQSEAAEGFGRRDAAYDIPAANPFIRRIFSFIVGPELEGEPFVSFVDDLTRLLAAADLTAIFADFGSGAARQDPVMHFYESFLAAYDPRLREKRGVYYTPEPVISYIVRSVDRLLKERFGCPEGLADSSMTTYPSRDDDGNPVENESHRVLVLDPACGTGSFLYAVVDHIRAHFNAAGNAGMWPGYVKAHLLPRLFGFELLMAPYAMAHLKLGMQLAAQDLPPAEQAGWAYEFSGNERLGVYLTNALEQSPLQQAPMRGPFRAITDEANAAAAIKREMPIMVVLGNPPYSVESANASRRGGDLTWIGELIEDYKKVDGHSLWERQSRSLNDDYVKFIRFGQWRIQQSEAGILAFITNHAYLDNPTFRGMRQQLLEAFSDIYLLNLHGNAHIREQAPDGEVDQNVFDIQQGVAIAIFVKEPDKSGPATVRYADLWGTRSHKYESLATSDMNSTIWESINPESPSYRFRPWSKELEAEYQCWPKITEIMPVNSNGVKTARDKLTIHWSPDSVMQTVQTFASLSAEKAREEYNLGRDTDGWKVQQAQDDIVSSGADRRFLRPILFRPFDTRYTYCTGVSNGFVSRPLWDVMRHMSDGGNWGLLFMRQVVQQGELCHFGVSDIIVNGRAFYSNKAMISLAPLYLYPTEQEIAADFYAADHREANLSPAFTGALAGATGLQFIPDGAGDGQETFGPEDVFHYIYAVFHSPTYRERYDQFLRADFPRVPLPTGAGLFVTLAGLGLRLVDAHLLRPGGLGPVLAGFPVAGDNVIARGYPKYDEEGTGGEGGPGRVWINRRQYFAGIEPDSWRFRIGGYQPLDKWLKDRRGRALSYDDLEHYRRIVAALSATRELMGEVDAAIADKGGLFGNA